MWISVIDGYVAHGLPIATQIGDFEWPCMAHVVINCNTEINQFSRNYRFIAMNVIFAISNITAYM